MKRAGRKSLAQTPSPKEERIYGSKVNKEGSASSETEAKSISFSDKVMEILKKKQREYNKENPSTKVSIDVLKAVFRRGAGAYSSSHRPTITGGRPNSRTAWAIARVNKFLEKRSGKEVKKAYVQDDDLLKKYHLGGDMSKHLAPNGKPSNLNHEQWHLVRTPEFKAWFGDWENDPENASKVVDSNGEPLVVYHGTKSFDITEFDLSQSKRKSSGIKEFGFYFTDNKKLAEAYRDWSELKEDEKVWIERQIYQLSELRDSTRNSEDFYDLEEQIRLLQFSKKGKIYGVFLNLKKMHSFDAKKEVNIEAWNNLKVKASYKIASNRDAMDFLKEGKFGVEKVDGIEAKNIVDAFVQTDELKKDLLSNVYLVFDSNNIKLADGSNTTFDPENPDIRFAKGGMTWSEYVKNQFDENEDRYLPSGYLGEFEIKTNTKEKYPILFKVKNDLEYRLRGENSSIIGVFDKNKQVADADNKVIQVAKSYQKKGIGLELVSILKQRNPNHRFASMTPEGFNLMGRYYDTYIANNPDSKFAKGGMIEVVLNEGNGVAINKLYNEWANIRTEKQQDAWAKKVRQTKFGSYGTIGFLEVLDKFEFMQSDKVNGVMKRDFIEEVKDALNTYAEGGLIAPNGKQSNLNAEQYKLVRTPEFKAWFGDWENDRQNSSKVVDSNGEPLVVYHGTKSEFSIFDLKKSGESNTSAKVGFWFTPLKLFAENFASDIWYGESDKLSVYSVFLNIKNPKIYETEIVSESVMDSLRKQLKDIQDKIQYVSSEWITGNWDLGNRMAFDYSERGMINDTNISYYSNLTPKSKDAIKDGEIVRNLNNERKALVEKLNDLNFSDSYERFKTDIFKQEGRTSYDANVGGLGMALKNTFETISKYRNWLKDGGFDGIIIKNTRFDKRSAGSNNDQYVALYPEQIKLADGSNTTFDSSNPDIRFAEGGSVEQTPKFGAVENSKYKGWSEEKVMSYDFPELYEIAEKHHAGFKTIRKEFIKGIFVEREHTSDWGMSAHVSLQHVFENPKYYTILQSLGL
jgi:hypothetical protein